VRDLIINEYAPVFDDIEPIRIHGDCHRANIIERPEEGLMVIDFDDMMMGPPVQDLWLLLPGHAHDVSRELNLILEGYETFMPFDDYSLKLIEPLRAMRMIYFLAWQKRQLNDPRFRQQNPEWGSDAFWQQELRDLEHQFHMINRSSHL
jgi:Ser/Thr protein kinase RdoA (MazF antagonist)